MRKQLRPKIGLLPTGLNMYFHQYPNLKEMGMAMYGKLLAHLEEYADVVSPGLVDTYETATNAADILSKADIDILLIFPFGYTTGMMIVPTVKATNVPIRLINAHEDASYDYKNADTELYLHHEGACPIPEYSCTLVALKRKFQVLTGYFGQEHFWEEIRRHCMGAAAASAYSKCRFGVIGNTYTNMVDMPVDDHRILRATGQLVCRPEIEEIEAAYDRVTDEQLKEMYKEFREYYDVDETVTDDHMRESAKIAVIKTSGFHKQHYISIVECRFHTCALDLKHRQYKCSDQHSHRSNNGQNIYCASQCLVIGLLATVPFLFRFHLLLRGKSHVRFLSVYHIHHPRFE